MPASRPTRSKPISVEGEALLAELDRQIAEPAAPDHVHPALGIVASDTGFKGWSFDGLFATSNTALTTGTIYVATMRLDVTGALSQVLLPLATAGSGLTGGFVGIYNTSGTQLAVSADQGAAWNTAGDKTVNMAAATASLAAGTLVRVAILAIGTTGPGVRCLPSAVSSPVNRSLVRFGNAGTAQTSLPASGLAVSASTPCLWTCVN